MSSAIVKCTFLFAVLTVFILVDAEPPRLRQCELANIFFRHGFSQYETRFSICYAKSKQYQAREITMYRPRSNGDKMFFFGMFPVAEPFCDNSGRQAGVCGISCKYTPEYNSENEVLCMKHVFEAELNRDYATYLKREEIKLSDCMRTIFDECRFAGPAGWANNHGDPVFLG